MIPISFLFYRKITKALFVLLPLLGVTWLVGIFALDENTLFFAWLFTLLNSLQVNNQMNSYFD